jgi:hypothetical protein
MFSHYEDFPKIFEGSDETIIIVTKGLKGLPHEMDLAFEDMPVLGLSRGRGQFLNFLVAPMIV